MIIDPTVVARRPDPERAREWLGEQRVFISSAMGDTTAERPAVAAAVQAEGAQPVWFEELGRDADPEQAYLTGVETATARSRLGVTAICTPRACDQAAEAVQTF